MVVEGTLLFSLFLSTVVTYDRGPAMTTIELHKCNGCDTRNNGPRQRYWTEDECNTIGRKWIENKPVYNGIEIAKYWDSRTNKSYQCLPVYTVPAR